MVSSKTRYVRLQVETLEDRSLLSGTLNWPIAPPANASISLMTTYGQFLTSGDQKLALHSGIDIFAAPRTPVRAIQEGMGVSVTGVPDLPPPNRQMSLAAASNGFNYVHLVPGINPNEMRRWAVNDPIPARPARNLLGQVEAAGAAFANHLHLDYTDTAADALYPFALRPIGDPLAHLSSLNDQRAPTIAVARDANLSPIHFRSQSSDTTTVPAAGGLSTEGLTTNHLYFYDTVAGGRLLIGARAGTKDATRNAAQQGGSADIDIVASMYDQLAAGGRKLNIKQNWFLIHNDDTIWNTGWISSFWFAGEFLGNGQNMNQFYNSNLTRVIYEHDRQSSSNGPSDVVSRQEFWYIMTNTDGDDVVQPTDRGRFWNSNVSYDPASIWEPENRWNLPNADDATSNANSQFPDGFYTITVAAEDEAGNSAEASRQVVLVNWERTVTTNANFYNPGDTITVTGGNQYKVFNGLNVHLVPAGNRNLPADGTMLNNGSLGLATASDANGQIPTANLNNAATPGRFFVITDYNGDGQYTPLLDAFKLITVRANTTTQLAANPNPSTVGQMVTLRATVSAVAPATGTPINRVLFYNGANLIGAAPLVNGVATLAVNTLPAGNLVLRAEYDPTSQFNTSSGTVNVTVNPPAQNRRSSQSTLTPSSANSVFGQAVTLTASVAPGDGNPGMPTGEVTFFDGSTPLGTVTLVNGTASLTVYDLTALTHSLIVDYGGDNDFNFVSATSTVVTTQATPTVTVSASGGTVNGLAFEAIATVAGVLVGVDDAPAETLEEVGLTLRYYLGASATGTPLSEPPIDPGTYTVVASFAGSGNYGSASSNPGTFVISKAVPTMEVFIGDGTFNGLPFEAIANIAGVIAGYDDFSDYNLEGVTPTLTYYDSSNSALSGPPISAGSYSVMASFPGSTTYSSITVDPIPFTINAVVIAFVNATPVPQDVDEDSALVFSSSNGNAIAITAPADGGDLIVQVALTATNGKLSLNGTIGLGFTFSDSEGTGAGTGTLDTNMTFRGSVNDINVCLAGLTFIPTANFHGAASLQIVTNDLGSSGSTSAMTDSDTVMITVNAVNDAPLNTVPGLQTANEDTAIVFSTAHGNAISIADLDAGATMQIFISALTTGGTMTLGSVTGLDFSFSDAYATGLGDGTNDESMCFRGSVSAINAALQGLTFTPAANWEGTNYIYTIESYDFTLLDSDQVELYFTPINDAPTGINHTVYTAQNTDYVIVATDFGFSDIDNDAFLAVRITSLASSGTLWWHNGTSWTTVSDEQEVSAADILNNKLKYVPPANTTGTATFTFRVRDDGGTANGGSDTDLTDRTLTVNIS